MNPETSKTPEPPQNPLDVSELLNKIGQLGSQYQVPVNLSGANINHKEILDLIVSSARSQEASSVRGEYDQKRTQGRIGQHLRRLYPQRQRPTVHNPRESVR